MVTRGQGGRGPRGSEGPRADVPRALFSEKLADLRADGGGSFALLILMGGDDVHERAADDHAVGDLGDGLDVGGGGDAEAD